MELASREPSVTFDRPCCLFKRLSDGRDVRIALLVAILPA